MVREIERGKKYSMNQTDSGLLAGIPFILFHNILLSKYKTLFYINMKPSPSKMFDSVQRP